VAKVSVHFSGVKLNRWQFQADAGTGVQTLSFRVPGKGKIRSFDELAVRFHLRGGRTEKSAKIATDRFDLSPEDR
jgi:hypothetical protein